MTANSNQKRINRITSSKESTVGSIQQQGASVIDTASSAINQQKEVMNADAGLGEKAGFTALNSINTGISLFQSIQGFTGNITQQLSEKVATPILKCFSAQQGTACYPVCKQLDIVLGIDLHFVNMPFAPGIPIPMPHPYIGILLRPKDFISIVAVSMLAQSTPPPSPPISEGVSGMIKNQAANFAFTVVSMAISQINGASVKLGSFLPRVVASTDTISIPHFPIGAGFYPFFDFWISKNNGHAFMGSLLTVADSKPLSGGAPHLHNDCWDIGIPSIPQLYDAIPNTDKALFDKAYKLKLYIPSGYIIPLPLTKGQVLTNPVPTPINPLTVVDKIFQAGFAKLQKAMSGKIENLIKRMEKTKLGKKLGCKFWATVSKKHGTGESHPVDVSAGHFYTDNKDFILSGMIPITWERTYYSYSDYHGSLGIGWHFEYDMALVFDDESSSLAAVRLKDGRPTPMIIPQRGKSFFNRREKLWFHRDEEDTYSLTDNQGLHYIFSKKLVHNRFNETESYPLESIRDNNGFHIDIKRDRDGIITSIIDTAGRTLTFLNDKKGHISEIHAPHPDFENDSLVCISRYEYDDSGRMTSQIDARGNAMTFGYENTLMVRETWRNGLTWNVRYDGTRTDAKALEIGGDNHLFHYKFTYSPGCTVVEKSLGDKTVYYHRNGLVTKRIDPNGGEYHFRHSADIDLEWERDALGNETSYTHDEWGNVLTVTAPDGGFTQMEYNNTIFPYLPTDATNEVGGQFSWKYDQQGNLREKKSPAGQTIKYKHKEGLLITIIEDENEMRLEYDKQHELVQAIAADGGITHWTNDLWGRCIRYANPKNGISEYKYDLNDNAIHVHEPDGNDRYLSYDTENNLVKAKDFDRTVNFTYRGVNKLVSRTENGIGIRFIYDTEDRLRAVINEHGERYSFDLDGTGNVIRETGFDNITRNYTRDLAGQVQSVTVGKNKTTHYKYDPVGRVTEVNLRDGTTENYSYRQDGALMTANNADARVNFERDKAGRVIKETSNGIEVASSYNSKGQRERITSSLGANITAIYNPIGDLIGMETGNWQTQFKRDFFGLEKERDLGNGITVTTDRDRLGRVTDQITCKGFLNIDRKEYFWGINDKLTHIVRNDEHTFFDYDDRGNLAKTTYHDRKVEHRNPDKVGNLYETEDRSDRKYIAGGQLTYSKDWNFKYDDEGNLIEKRHRKYVQQVWTYKWNGAGMLASVTRPDGILIRYWYDALGRRIQKRIGDSYVTKFLWDGNVILHEQKNDEPIVTWIFEEGTFVPTGKIVGDEHFQIVSNYLGTPEAMYNQMGECVWWCSLSSYGAVKKVFGDRGECPFVYQGMYFDKETNLCYNRYRYFDSNTGSYLSQDPIGLAGNNPTLYGYVPDPNSWLDPFGLDCGKSKRKHANSTSGNNSAAQRGKQAHKDFQKKVAAKEGWTAEPNTTMIGVDGKTYKPDALTPSGRFVELKPNTPRGRSRGRTQAKKYREQLGIEGRVVYYDP